MIVLAIGTFAIALAGELSSLASIAPLTTHMIQHILLAMVIPPLWILGGGQRWLPSVRLKLPVAWLLGIIPMLLSHLPAAFHSAHATQLLLALSFGYLFWLPVFSENDRLEPIVAIPYLAIACMACSVVGILIAFASPGLYAQPHQHMPHSALSLADDQLLAGLILWVPGCLIYLSAMLVSLSHWYRLPEGQEFAS